MADLVISNVVMKKSERGNYRFIIYDSDGVALRNLTGNTYTFKFWQQGAASNKGSGLLSIVDAINGVADYAVQATDTDTAGSFIGELIENIGTSNELHSAAFSVTVLDGAPA